VALATSTDRTERDENLLLIRKLATGVILLTGIFATEIMLASTIGMAMSADSGHGFECVRQNSGTVWR
jgi:hypothetical protein